MFLIGLITLAINLLALSSASRFNRYKTYFNKTVSLELEETLRMVDTIKVSSRIQCATKCNLLDGCEVYALNSSDYCTLYSDQTTIFDVVDSSDGIHLYGLNGIKACVDPDYYPEFNMKTCLQKMVNNEVCNSSVQCSDMKGLECNQNNTCQCMKPDVM